MLRNILVIRNATPRVPCNVRPVATDRRGNVEGISTRFPTRTISVFLDLTFLARQIAYVAYVG
jgi:hypothetical protein